MNRKQLLDPMVSVLPVGSERTGRLRRQLWQRQRWRDGYVRRRLRRFVHAYGDV